MIPFVSIIIPCYNEQATISLLLSAICAQTYPLKNLEVVIADGRSTDQTRECIAKFQHSHPELLLRVIDNPQRHIPTGLNLAIRSSRGDYIIRLDAHSVPQADYVARCIDLLEAGKGDNVGGVWEIQPHSQPGEKPTWIARSIAAAAAHPLGVGDAFYRFGNQAREVDTAPFGSFKRSLFDRIGYFDETLLSNEDYEFNTRIRQSGGRVWLDPSIRSVYFARPNLLSLARQYLRYGYWKGRMLARYPQSLRWRQMAPPLFALSLAGLCLLSFSWSPAGWLFFAEIGLYLLTLLSASLKTASTRRDLSLLIGMPLAISVMHLCWGSALLWSLATLPFGSGSPSIKRNDSTSTPG